MLAILIRTTSPVPTRIAPFLCVASIPVTTKKRLPDAQQTCSRNPPVRRSGIPYTIHYSDRRKTLVIKFSPDLSVTVGAPRRAQEPPFRPFLKRNPPGLQNISTGLARYGPIPLQNTFSPVNGSCPLVRNTDWQFTPAPISPMSGSLVTRLISAYQKKFPRKSTASHGLHLSCGIAIMQSPESKNIS